VGVLAGFVCASVGDGRSSIPFAPGQIEPVALVDVLLDVFVGCLHAWGPPLGASEHRRSTVYRASGSLWLYLYAKNLSLANLPKV